MKNIKSIYLLILGAFVVWSCDQELADVQPNPDFTPVASPINADPGSADFSKFVAVGNSLTAGFQAAALFDEGQANSLPAILNKQFQAVGGGDFNQPDIESENGFNRSFSDLANGIIAGRLILAGTPPGPTPTAGDLPTAYAGDKAELNNFGVPGILLVQSLIPNTGTPGDAFENGLYTRFASAPGTSTIIGDAAAAQGTFFMFWLGNNDILGYASTGGSGAIPLTDPVAFEGQYQAAIAALTMNPETKGVVGNIPNITSIPFFTLVPWNPIPMDQATADLTNPAYAAYNGGLQNLADAMAIPQSEVDKRKIEFAPGANAMVIADESLIDLSGFGLPSIRQTTAEDLVILSASRVIGTLADPNNPASVFGVGVPMADNYILTSTELTEISDAITAYNMTIKGIADANPNIAYADVNTALANLTAAGGGFVDGVLIAPTFAPPAGLFSEDGVHPNSRGYAFTARTFIDAINAQFGATIPQVNIAEYAGTGLPQ